MFKNNKLLTNIILAIIPLLVYAGFIIYHSNNLFILDDYTQIVLPFVDSLKANSISQFFQAMFSQQNEYRFPVLATFSLFQYFAFDKINFTYYIYYGNLSMYGIAFLVFYTYRKVYDWQKLLPIFYLLFPFQAYIIMTWACPSSQYLCALYYGIATIFFLNENTRKMTLWAYVMAFMSVFSFGSGLISLFIGLGLLVISRRKKEALYWLIYTGILVLGYFTNYKSQNISDTGLISFGANIWNITLGYLYLNGAWADITLHDNTTWKLVFIAIVGFFTAVATLIVMVQLLPKVIKNVASKHESFTFFVLMFVVCILLIITIGRSRATPEVNSFVSNHRYYSSLVVALIFCYFINSFSFTTRRVILIASVLMFSIGFLKYNFLMSERTKDVVTDRANHYLNPILNTDSQFQNVQNALDKDLKDLGAFSFPSIDLHQKWETAWKSSLNGELKINQKIGNNGDGNTSIVDRSFEEISMSHLGTNGIYFVLKSDKNTYFFPTKKTYRSIKFWRKSNNEVSANIEKGLLTQGTYQLYLCLYQNKNIQYFKTDKVIQI
jgi:hypothetical protein